jgi:hypothetical protein
MTHPYHGEIVTWAPLELTAGEGGEQTLTTEHLSALPCSTPPAECPAELLEGPVVPVEVKIDGPPEVTETMYMKPDGSLIDVEPTSTGDMEALQAGMLENDGQVDAFYNTDYYEDVDWDAWDSIADFLFCGSGGAYVHYSSL